MKGGEKLHHVDKGVSDTAAADGGGVSNSAALHDSGKYKGRVIVMCSEFGWWPILLALFRTDDGYLPDFTDK